MATNASPFIVNIVPLQNIPTNILGTNDVSLLQTQVANIQTMVNTSNHTIYADAFSNFTSANPAIDIYANLNLSNTNLYYNSNIVTLNTSGSSSGTSSITQTVRYGSSTTNSGASTIVTFVSTFTSIPNVVVSVSGYVPNFITLDNISISSFKAYSWSGTVKAATTSFQWQAVA
uniref:Uncharacterized protein n=1 Tax=viral metagenome TaxID=1070528 RepID=A0A6C0K6E4_9ZZZZ